MYVLWMFETSRGIATNNIVSLAVLQSTYPVLHYVILLLLSASICLAFLMETNIDLLIFLSAIQLRILVGSNVSCILLGAYPSHKHTRSLNSVFSGVC